MRPLKKLMDLSGRSALVTGGAGHVGLAVGEALLELGAQLALLDLDEQSCQQRVTQLKRRYPRARILSLPCDLTLESDIRLAVRQCAERLKGLDILIHCAAYVGTTKLDGWSVSFDRQTVKAWDAALRVNLTAAFVLLQEARDALESSGRGSAIFIASTYGLVGPDMRLYEGTSMDNPAGYGASKGGLLQLTRHLATLLAPKVRVNAITPGGIWRNQPKTFQKRYVERTPLRRMASEEDLKGAIAYLASDLSAYVTGHNLVVDGGWTVW